MNDISFIFCLQKKYSYLAKERAESSFALLTLNTIRINDSLSLCEPFKSIQDVLACATNSEESSAFFLNLVDSDNYKISLKQCKLTVSPQITRGGLQRFS